MIVGQSEVIKKINKHFKENWKGLVLFDAPNLQNVKDESIYIQYSPIGTDWRYLGTEKGRVTMGVLRVFCYHRSQTLALAVLDDVNNFLIDKNIDGICYYQAEAIGGEILEDVRQNASTGKKVNAGDLYVYGVSFTVETRP